MTGITLKELMNIEPFTRARLVGGRRGLERLVSSANIQEVPNVAQWLHGGEILFTAGYAFQNAEGGVRLLAALERRNVAALAIKTGQYLPKIPQTMIDYADAHDFPLFLLPEDLPYMDCILPIFDRITQNQIEVMKRNEEIHNQLIQVIVEGLGLEGICSVLSRAALGPAAVLSPSGVILALDTGAKEKKDETREAVVQELSRYLFSKSSAKRMKKNKCNFLHGASGQRRICIPVFVKEEHIAYLVLNYRSETSGIDLLAFENASSLVAVELLKEQAALNEERRIKEQLLDDLLAKRYGDREVILRRGGYVGFDFTKKSFIFLLGVDSFEKRLANGRGISERKIQRIKNEMRAELERHFSEAKLPVLLLGSGMDMLGLVQQREDEDRRDCVRILTSVIAALTDKYGQLHFSAGIGRERAGMERLGESWNEARYAIKAGRNLRKSESAPHITRFEELGCLCFLCELENISAADDFYHEYMDAIERYDRENKGVLIETLEAYFSNGSNIRRTAEALFVHKNSVIYRLGKIEELLGKRLSDDQVLFHLQMCLKLRQLR